jgi:GTP-binding protein
MLIKSATFLKSVTNIKDCPKSIAHDFAFIGRSNVGKSSLINMLVNRKQLAKTSGKPGKTQTINFFLINDKWHLVDLPGYGWAGVSKEKKIEWVAFVRDYLLKRENLFCLFILIDIRHEPQSIDLEFINWAGENRIPFALVFTKTDKISKNKVESSIAYYKKRLLRDWESLPDIFSTSALKHQGKEEILNFIDKINSA